MLKRTGVPDRSQIKDAFPDESYLIKPKAIIECFEAIPCNPCETSCPVGAITIGADINKIPVIDHAICTGCGQCVHNCPGLAVHIVSIKEDKALFRIPYEMPDVPKQGDIWDGIGRDGKTVCEATITAVTQKEGFDKTTILNVETDKTYLYDFITVRRP